MQSTFEQSLGRASAAQRILALLASPLRRAPTGIGFCAAIFLLVFVWNAQAQAPGKQQLLQEAHTAQQQGNKTLAVSKYEEILKLYPNMAAAHVGLGAVFSSLGQYDKAIAQYRTALTETPRNPTLRFNLALTYFKKRDFTTAARQFAALHQADPTNIRTASLLGDCYVHLRLYPKAIALLTPLEAANADNLNLEWALGMALVAGGRTQEGLVRVEKVARQGRNAEAYLLAAEAYLKLSFYSKAHRNADQAIRLNPNLLGVYTVQGIIETCLGNKKAATTSFRKALQANPDDAQAHLQLGLVLYTEHDLNAARNQLDRAIDLNPHSFYAHYELARVEGAQGHLHAELSELQNAERENPQWLPPHVELAALYYRLKKPAEGARERKIVNQLMAEEQQRKSKWHIVSHSLR